MAEDYLRMGIVKAQKMEPLEPVSRDRQQDHPRGGRRRDGHHRGPGGGRGRVRGHPRGKAAPARRLRGEPSRSRFPKEPPYTEIEADGPGGADSGRELSPQGQGVHRRDDRPDHGPARPVRRDHRGGRQHRRPPCGRHRHGHGLEALRRGQARAPGLRSHPGRGHQRGVREDGGRGTPQAALGREGRRERPLRPVRRLPRQGPPALLLLRVLHGDPQALRARPPAERGRQGLHRLQGHAHAGTVREVLRQGPEPPGDLPHQGRGVRGGKGRRRASSRWGSRTRSSARPSRWWWTSWSWPRAWCRTPRTARPSGSSTTPGQGAEERIGDPARRGREEGGGAQAPRGHGHPQPHLPPGSGPARPAVRLPRLALRLLPLRDAPDGHLRGGQRCARRWTRPTPRKTRSARP